MSSHLPTKRFKTSSIFKSNGSFKLSNVPVHHFHLGDNYFLTVNEFCGKVLIHYRKYRMEEDLMVPTKEGITLQPLTWQEFVDNIPFQNFHYYVRPRRETLINGELFISQMDRNVLCFQKVLSVKDRPRQFIPCVMRMTEQQWNTLDSYLEDIQKSIFSVMFEGLFRKIAFSNFKKLAKQKSSLDTPIGEQKLLSSLTELLNDVVHRKMNELITEECDGCERMLANQLGHDCIYMPYETQFNKYFKKSVCKIDIKDLATKFVLNNVAYSQFFTNVFFDKLNFKNIFNTIREMFVANDPNVGFPEKSPNSSIAL